VCKYKNVENSTIDQFFFEPSILPNLSVDLTHEFHTIFNREIILQNDTDAENSITNGTPNGANGTPNGARCYLHIHCGAQTQQERPGEGQRE
jgi:hypothetical protein